MPELLNSNEIFWTAFEPKTQHRLLYILMEFHHLLLKRVTDQRYLKRDGMSPVTNAFDEFALEEALLTREKYDGDIVAITMGPEKANDVLRNALALTVNEVHRCTDDAFAGSDTFATASVLATAVKKIGDVDVVFCGKQSTDGNTGVVGAELAAILGWSPLTYVSKVRQIDAASKKIVVERAIGSPLRNGLSCWSSEYACPDDHRSELCDCT
jgi:electron transfer flavoprotein beta subunit